MLEDQARRRSVSENAAVLIRQPSFGRADPAPTIDDLALSLHEAGLRRDRPNKRNLELEGRLRKPLVEHGQDGETHAAVEQRRSKASVNPAEWVAVLRMRLRGGDNAAFGNLDNVVPERFRHRVQRQRPIDESLNKFKATHCLLLIVIDDAEAFSNGALRHALFQ
jgi:hypothetical protein